MLYQPSFPSPYLSTIDANEKNTFRFQVNGDYITAYQILIYNASTNELVYDGDEIKLEDQYIYGNDGDDSFVEVTIPAFVLTNGLDYVWKVKLWQKEYDIEVARGRVYEEVSSGTSIKIRPHIEDSVREGMVLRIGTQDYTIHSCVLQYPKIYANVSTSLIKGVIYVDTSADVVRELTSGTYVMVGGIGNSYNKTSKTCQVQAVNYNNHLITLSDKSISYTTSGISYIQNITPSLYSTAKLHGTISSTIPAGTEYVVLSNYVECDVGFFFQARTTPELTVYNNNEEITNNMITNTHSSIDIKALYTQQQGSNIKYWNITLKSNGRVVNSTGNVYNGKIEYHYDSLLPQKYVLDIVVENSDGTVLEKNIGIDVQYNDANALMTPNTKLEYDSAVKIDWSDSSSIIGESTFEVGVDSYDKDSQCLILKDGQSVLWDNVDGTKPLNLEEPTVVSILVTNIYNYDGKILEVFDSNGTDKIEVGYNSKEFWWTVNGMEYTFNPYTEGTVVQVGVPKNNAIPPDTLYLWDSSDAEWNSSGDYVWHYNDVGTMYWWLIKINLHEQDHSKMVKFTKYDKE